MHESQLELFANEASQIRATRTLLDELLSKSRLFSTTDAYRQLLEFVVRLRNVAPFNAMLLQLQKPGLTYAASAHDWETRFHRRIKEDARPLLILWPFAPVVTVYDVLDTFDPMHPEQEGLPNGIASFFAAGPITEMQIRNFKKLLEYKKIGLEWFDGGDGHAGVIRTESAFGTKYAYTMKLNHNHSAAVQFNTLAHELGHLYLGHLGANKTFNIPARPPMTHRMIEIEAESVAYIVCERNGIHTNSEAYLHHFVAAGVTGDNLDLYQIMRAAGQVEGLLDLSLHTKYPH
jgi:hypothetical protein